MLLTHNNALYSTISDNLKVQYYEYTYPQVLVSSPLRFSGY